jgi:putative ABC transport system permease protein
MTASSAPMPSEAAKKKTGFGLVLRLARRELRGGLSSFWVFLSSLALGVAAIAAVGTVSSAILTGLDRDARLLLGGDVDLRSIHRPVSAKVARYIAAEGTVTEIIGMRAMAEKANVEEGRRVLVEMKAVGDAYPLVGKVLLDPVMDLSAALAPRDGLSGAVIDRSLAARLEVDIGDRMRVGDGFFELRALIEKEPDRAVSAFATFGPRLMIAMDGLASTGLVREGSLIRYHNRVRLPEDVNLTTWIAALKERFPDAGFQVRSRARAAPGFSAFVDRLGLYLSLVGLTALLVGGVGIANAVKSFLDRRTATIATLKCLGASSGIIFGVYFVQVLFLATIGTGLGLLLGGFAPWVVATFASSLFPFTIPVVIDPLAMMLAAAFGFLTAAVFALWPIGKAVQIKAGHLFRALIQPPPGLPQNAVLLAVAVGTAALIALTVFSSADEKIAIGFVAGVLVTFVIFRAAAWAISVSLKQLGRVRWPGLRLAIANITRPGAPTGNLVLSLGLGVAVLIAVALVDANLRQQVTDRMPAAAPGYYFIDIQPQQIDGFVKVVKTAPGETAIQRTPMVRGRVTAIAGRPVDDVAINPDVAWTLRGDRGLTYMAAKPAAADIVDGVWWPADYAGPPLVSIDANVASGYGVGIGDTLGFNILGREVTAEIASLRNIDWTNLSMNFVFVFSPGLLEVAPHSIIASVKTESADIDEVVQKAVSRQFRNISAIRVKDALDAATKILSSVDFAVRLTAMVTLVAGILVLAGAIGAEHRRRIQDGVILKVLGATRWRVIAAHLFEYGLLGLITATIAAAIGTSAAWVLLAKVMGAGFVFSTSAVFGTVAACLFVTIGFGLIGTWRALGLKVAPMLRNEG